MKKQQKNILLILLFSGFSMVSSATLAMCRMSDIGAGQIRLQPVSGSTSTTGVSVECDRMFTIKFDSQNMLNMNGESMLKGQHDEGEELIDTALREFKEESTIDLSKYKDKLVYLGDVQQSKYKTVHAFALNLEHISSIDPKKCKSNMSDNCPWPEIDKYRWMSYSDVISKTHKTHIDFYNKILELEK